MRKTRSIPALMKMKKVLCLTAVIVAVCLLSIALADDTDAFLGKWICSKVIIDGKTYTMSSIEAELELAVRSNGTAIVHMLFDFTTEDLEGFWLAEGSDMIVTDGQSYILFSMNAAGKLVLTAGNAEFILDHAPSVEINEENFPDENFREYVADYLDGEDGLLSGYELSRKELTITGAWKIKDLTGIEYFTDLRILDCQGNLLTSLDLSGNKELRELNCYKNQLTHLDVSKCTKLTTLHCGENELTQLDVSNNKALKELYCDCNRLTELNVSKNTKLEWMGCSNNQLSRLDVSKNKKLIQLFCFNNQLTSLNLSRNAALNSLECGGNRLTKLDVSHNVTLSYLVCSGNPLTSLDISQNTGMQTLFCDGCGLTQLDVSKQPKMRYLVCSGNRLTTLDVTGNPDLWRLECSDNLLTSLDLSKNKALYELKCSNNSLTSLDVSKNKKLNIYSMDCDGNQLEISTFDGKILFNDLPGFKIAKASGFSFAADEDAKGTFKKGKEMFTVTGSGIINYTYQLDAARNVTKTFSIKVNYLKTDISSVKLARKSYAYTGEAIEPAVTVKVKANGSTVTLKKTDYTVTYENNTEVGTATVTVEGKGNYQGTIILQFSIVRAKISTVTLGKTKMAYTGTAQEPAVTVKRNAKVLTEGTDYTVAYTNNVNAGEATVTVKGIGNYKGTITRTFTITPVKILKVSLSNYKLPYTGKARKPIPTVTTKVNGQLVTLVKGTDYTVRYENNTETGTAVVTITGKGNYTGTITKTFTITAP